MNKTKTARGTKNNTAFLSALMTSALCLFIAASALCPPAPPTACDVPMLRSADIADFSSAPGRSAELTEPSDPDGEPIVTVRENKQIFRPITSSIFADLKMSGYTAGPYRPPKSIVS